MRLGSPVLICSLSVLALTGCAERTSRVSQIPPRPPVIAVSAPDGVIPAGTTLGIRTIETINSRTAVEGRTYAAEISQDVVNGSGRVLIPKGSPARIAITQTKDSGKISGAEVQFALRTVTVNGKDYDVSTASMKRGAGLGANRQTAETVGTGAVLGTMVGAAAGHGQGAAIGAAAGALAGAAIEVFARDKELEIPSETLLSFKLDQSLRLTPQP